MSVARHLARLQVRIETIAENHSLPGQTGLSLQDTLVALTFSGFSDDIVIIVASALVVSAAVARSGVMEAALQRVSPYITSLQLQVDVLVFTVTVLSAFVKNIGGSQSRSRWPKDQTPRPRCF